MRKLVTIRKIERVEEIPGADNICIVIIDGWQMIAKKEEFKQGDLCVFFEIDSILPDKPIFEFMRGRKFRVKTIKCMKQISQGLALPLSILSEFGLEPKLFQSDIHVGTDLTDTLGVTKYDPEAVKEAGFHREVRERKPDPWYIRLLKRIPFIRNFFIKKSGRGFPTHIVSKTDEERFQNCSSGMKESFLIEPIYITEKVDGTSTTFIYRPSSFFRKEEFMVCSRNFLKEFEDDSWWWTIARKINMKEKMKTLFKEMKINANSYLVIQGETIGPDIQSNKYNVKDYDFFVYNIKVVSKERTIEYNPKEIDTLINMHVPELKTVPLIEEKCIDTVEELDTYIKNRTWGIKSGLNPDMIMEGVVVRTANQNLTRFKSFKYINPEFLVKYGE
jgi:hypothetical protein